MRRTLRTLSYRQHGDWTRMRDPSIAGWAFRTRYFWKQGSFGYASTTPPSSGQVVRFANDIRQHCPHPSCRRSKVHTTEHGASARTWTGAADILTLKSNAFLPWSTARASRAGYSVQALEGKSRITYSIRYRMPPHAMPSDVNHRRRKGGRSPRLIGHHLSDLRHGFSLSGTERCPPPRRPRSKGRGRVPPVDDAIETTPGSSNHPAGLRRGGVPPTIWFCIFIGS